MPFTLPAGEHPAARSVALLIEVSSGHARGLIRGVSRYAQEHGPWRLLHADRLAPADVRWWLRRNPCDGAIARVETPAIAAALARARVPVVNVAGATRAADRWPRVDTDNRAVCALAAAHLVERGYRHFAFCGIPNVEWSRWRQQHFAAELDSRRLTCEAFDVPTLTPQTPPSARDRRALSRWLVQLAKPVGIMAANDHCGRAVLEACAEAALAVPDEVGVIGVDNDDLVCELCAPPLTSVEANVERIGYVAAETLAQLLNGAAAVAPETLIKPTTLVTRRSTDAAAVREPIVAEALRFIRAYACQSILVPDVARHVNVSRRYLEQQFRRTVGRSIHSEIQRLRLETAQRLLGETDWKLQTIAERAGFSHAAHMSEAFQRKLGMRPGGYRERMKD